MSQLKGEKILLVDSVTSDENGRFIFELDTHKHKSGIYRLSLGENKWLDFVNDDEVIRIKTDANDIPDSLIVGNSESNKIYYYFLKLNKEYKTKTELLQFFLTRYPKEDELYPVISKRLKQLQNEYLEFVLGASQKNPKSFIARYTYSVRLPVIDFDLPVEKQLVYLKKHALDNVDFNDDDLINSDCFTSKTIEYLTYYRDPQLPKELLEKEFTVAVDSLLNKAKVNSLVYKHIVEYLLDGFKKFGFDTIINYILENYVIKDDICLDQTLESAINRRMEQSKYFKLGNTVPNIISMDSSGKQIDLYSINLDRVLIIFYASWCSHCQMLMTQLNELYQSQKIKKTEVFAVSIDISKLDWTSFLTKNNITCINVSDLHGWKGKAVLDYYIYATPTMFIADGEKKLISKPLTIVDLKKWFDN